MGKEQEVLTMLSTIEKQFVERQRATEQTAEQARQEYERRGLLVDELGERMEAAGIDHTSGSENEKLWNLYNKLDELFPDNPSDSNYDWTEFDKVY